MGEERELLLAVRGIEVDRDDPFFVCLELRQSAIPAGRLDVEARDEGALHPGAIEREPGYTVVRHRAHQKAGGTSLSARCCRGFVNDLI